jgi:hypothetical protein
MSIIENLNFDMLNLHDLSSPFNLGIIGSIGTGKKWLIRELLHFFVRQNMFSNYVIISPNEKQHGFFKYCTKGKIYERLTPELINKIIKFQKRQSEDIYKIKPMLVIILDQYYINKTKNRKDREIYKNFFSNLHSSNISTIVTQQYPSLDFVKLGYNYEYLFINKIDFITNMKRVYDIFFKHSMNYPLFEKIHNYLTKGYTFMVVKNWKIQRPIEEYIYYYLVNKRNNDFNVKLLDLDNSSLENDLFDGKLIDSKICPFFKPQEIKEIKVINESDSDESSQSGSSLNIFAPDDKITDKLKNKLDDNSNKEPFDINKFVQNNSKQEINKLQMMETILNMNKEILDYILKN